MLAMDSSALAALGRLLSESTWVDPVAIFSKRTDIATAGPDLQDAFSSNDEQRLRAAAEREWELNSRFAEVFLDVQIHEREDVRAEDIVAVDDVAFELPTPLREFLCDKRLFFERGRFLLRDRDGRMVDLPFGPPDSRLRGETRR